MASCAKCGAELIGAAKFCSACGAPVAPLSPAGSSRPPPSQTPAADPFAQTAFAGNSGAYGPPPAPIGALPSASTPQPATKPGQSGPVSPVGVSPLASSGVVPPSSRSVPFPRATGPGAAPPAYGGAPPAPQGQRAPPYAAPPSPQPAPGGQGAWGARPAPNTFGPGARVLVQWADGKRYPGTVKQAAGAQCLVVFEGGQQRWIDVKFISPGF